jgi:[acyl-carrier-protein] S-malonyltransferase
LPAFVFPGQRFQQPGVGRAWRDHPSWDVVQDASDVVGRDVERLLLDAGAEELSETRNAQLATFVMGLVVVDAVERLGIEPTACAGYSLGEYTALVAAGAIGFEDSVRLVAERGEAMQEASEENPGIMLALGGIDDERARIACERAEGDVWLANSNAPGECAIAGRAADAYRAAGVARELGARAVSEVAGGGPFHTPLMAPAQPRLRKALEITTFFPLAVPVVSNVDALPHSGAGEWAALLSAQLRSPVRWRQSVLSLTEITRTGEPDGDNLFCELGPGSPLSAMVSATAPEVATVSIIVPDDLDTLVATMMGEATLHSAIDGHQGERLYVSERLVISPCAGIFELSTEGSAPASPGPDPRPLNPSPGVAGRLIQIGDLLGFVSGTEVRSPFAGELMGLLAHPGERVQTGQPIAWLRANQVP